VTRAISSRAHAESSPAQAGAKARQDMERRVNPQDDADGIFIEFREEMINFIDLPVPPETKNAHSN
jgi:hypothetical protein